MKLIEKIMIFFKLQQNKIDENLKLLEKEAERIDKEIMKNSEKK